MVKSLENKVSIVKCQSYSKNELTAAIKKCVDLIGGFEKFIAGGKKILLKPNLLSPSSPDFAVTTHPVFIESIIDIILKLTGDPSNIVIADSPGAVLPHTQETLLKTYEVCGLNYLQHKSGINLNMDTGFETVAYRDGKVLKTLEIIKPVLDADLIINLPKFKTHSLTMVTGAVKNMYGIIHGRTKTLLHTKFMEIEKFNDMLIDIYSYKRPAINVIDGIMGMEGEGPGSSGTPRKTGFVIAGTNGIAIDNIMGKIMGIKDGNLPLINCAEKRGIDGWNTADIEVLGENINNIIIHDFKLPKNTRIDRITKNRFINTYILPFVRNNIGLSPYQNKNKCNLCKQCIEACPELAITELNNVLKFNYKKCIRCYCCSEMCPQGAIDLKYSFIGNLIFSKILKT